MRAKGKRAGTSDSGHSEPNGTSTHRNGSPERGELPPPPDISVMKVTLAYITVVLIWSTTPLAIKWSVNGPGFLFGVSSRMTIGAICVLLYLAITRQPLPWNRNAVRSYLAVSIQIYASMLAVYWGAQFIPSGWVSVIFGLTPILTAVMAGVWLGERSLTISRLAAYGLGLAGLGILFGSALDHSPDAYLGIMGVLLSAFFQAAGSVAVKRVDSGLPSMTMLGGGLLFSVIGYLATWAIFDGNWPDHLSTASALSILYLGLIATTMGFAMYYYVLKHLAATRVSLINLITPVTALLLGHIADNEPVTPRLVLGTFLILSALLMHEIRLPDRTKRLSPKDGRRFKST